MAHLGRSGLLRITLPHEFSMYIPALECQKKTPCAQTRRGVRDTVVAALMEEAQSFTPVTSCLGFVSPNTALMGSYSMIKRRVDVQLGHLLPLGTRPFPLVLFL